MTTQRFIKEQAQFRETAKSFFEILFGKALQQNLGQIEIQIIPKNGYVETFYFGDIDEAVNKSHELCEAGVDVYFGVNPRIGGKGGKENVQWLTTFHADVDYGVEGHKKKSGHKDREDTQQAINDFQYRPTVLVHSGGGFHCYWILNDPVNVPDNNVTNDLELINKALIQKLDGDVGTQNINRILRVPGTYNFKDPENPKEVIAIFNNGPKYDFHEFEPLIQTVKKEIKSENSKSKEVPAWDQDMATLPVSDKMKSLIIHGNDGTYASRSEADQAVITALVNKGYKYPDIKTIFENFKIGEKYREHKSGDGYLNHNIEKAKEFSNLTEEERQDPLFICGALHKDNNGKYHLKIVPFQEHMNKKHMLRYLEKEKAFFRYNGQCYEQCHEERLNFLCQSELGVHRDRFSKSALSNFMHFSIADDLIGAERAYEDQVRYLTMQNGLYDLVEHKLVAHSPDIFTTNLLPYDYDPNAQCPRWMRYLNEVFMGDENRINFIQEAIGYAFHKAIPKPALFFLVGRGSNGKSVFIDTLTYLCGKENVSNISWNLLSNEIYILDLFGKMINVSSETPNNKFINTDLVKAVVGGDWVTGRELYKRPSKFKPFAKHYLAMNQLPTIVDDTHGMWRRIYVIEFQRTFAEEEMDVELTEKLKQELSGIFNWALAGFKRLRDQKFIFSESTSMRVSKKQYQVQSNSALKFIDSLYIKASNDSSVPLKTLYDQYKAFCELEGDRKPYLKRQFRESLERQGYKIENSSKHSNQVRVFGLGHRPDE